VIIANFHLSPILYCLPPLSYFQHQKIQGITLFLGRFQLRSDLLQAWMSLTLVSVMQNRVYNLVLMNDDDCLPFISRCYYNAFHFHRISNTAKYTDTNGFTGSIPTEIGSLTSLDYLYFCEFLANTCT
jgi:hypothetical protein